MRNVIIVGSGASGVAAALALSDRGIRPTMIDVGLTPPSRPSIDDNFYDYRAKNDTFEMMLGNGFEGLSNMWSGREVPVKLTAPFSRFVTQDADSLSPLVEKDFAAVQSFARGGLANAWGAGLYRFTADDLAGFPVRVEELDSHFDRLTAEIGIAGTDDDLSPYFGSTTGLIDPLPLSRNVADFYSRYRKSSTAGGIAVGRARVAALTREYNGRPAFKPQSLEFFQENRSIYSPRYTLDRLETEGRIGVNSGVLVESFREDDTGVTILARNVTSGESLQFRADTLLLAAGAINTTKLVLASTDHGGVELPLLENPAVQFPLVMPRALGRRIDSDAFGLVQLNLIWDSEVHNTRLQGSIMEITAPARAEFFAGLPYSARANMALIRYMLPGMIVMQLFFPGESQPPASVSLKADGSLRITGQPNTLDLAHLRPLIRFLRRFGAITAQRLVVRVPTGHAVHYAGSLPMSVSPKPYECYPNGQLFGTKRIFVADSAAFSRLPAKNMSFAMMANAMRVAYCATTESP